MERIEKNKENGKYYIPIMYSTKGGERMKKVKKTQ